MCGRFALFTTKEDIEAEFDLTRSLTMKNRYNIYPSESIPVIIAGQQLTFMRWGLIPYWQKDNPQEEDFMPSGFANARSETVNEKPSFKRAYKKNRCIIIASGYYEWKVVAKEKQPYYIHLRTSPFIAMAGIFDQWKSKNGLVESCAILTRDSASHSVLSAVHDRMPILLNRDQYQDWLKGMPLEDIALPENDDYEAYPVTKKVGVPSFDAPICVQPLLLS